MSGWSDFWIEVRKIAKAVNKQQGWRESLAALISLRLALARSLGAEWQNYLTADSPQEREVMEEQFVPQAQ